MQDFKFIQGLKKHNLVIILNAKVKNIFYQKF